MIEVGQTVGNYRIVAKLGEGGMGVVFSAEHPVIARRAALKAIHPDFAPSPDALSRFVAEAKLLGQVGHEHIVDVTDFGRTPEGDSYFIMEYLSGEALSETIHRGAPLPPARALAIAAQVADALEGAHGLGIVHCDLKPENVFLIRRGGTRDFVKVLDFGLARLASGEAGAARRSHTGGMVTMGGLIMGTPYYMAPEQCQAVPDVDGRADIYALGVILFEMLTGKLPFGGETASEVLVNQVTKPVPAARSIRPELPEAVDRLLGRALAKDPADRFPSMAAFGAALLELAAVAGPAPVRPSGLLPARAERAGAASPARRTTLGEGVGAFASASDLELPPPRERRLGWLAVVGAALALVALAVGLPRAGRAAPDRVAAVPAPPASVRLSFGSEPAGADVVGADGRVVGRTPLALDVATSEYVARYVLRKGAYIPKTISVIPNLSSQVFVVLEALPVNDPPSPPARRRATRPTGPALGAPAVGARALGDDDVLAPGFR
jgi:hypothetical protein